MPSEEDNTKQRKDYYDYHWRAVLEECSNMLSRIDEVLRDIKDVVEIHHQGYPHAFCRAKMDLDEAGNGIEAKEEIRHEKLKLFASCKEGCEAIKTTQEQIRESNVD